MASYACIILIVGQYSCARQSLRWPMRLIYFLLDTAGVNSFVAFSLMHPEWKNHRGSTLREKRKFCMLEVIKSLVDEHVRRRAQNRMIAGRPLVASAVALLGVIATLAEPKTQSTCNERRGQCANCPRTKDQKVTRFQNGTFSHLHLSSMSNPIH